MKERTRGLIRSGLRYSFLAALILLLPLMTRNPLLSQENQECMECHGDPDLVVETEEGLTRSLFVNIDNYRASVHGELSCIDCHADIEEIPHPEKLQRVDCSICHDDIQEEYLSGVHGKAFAAGDPDAPMCRDCHGTHTIRSSSDSTSFVHKLNQAHTCAQCHSDEGIVRRHRLAVRHPSEMYLSGAHNRALHKGNLEAAACNDCHESHGLRPLSDPESPIYRTNVPRTCGKCHKSVTAEYLESIHGVALLQGASAAPNCTDCHGEHAVRGPEEPTSPVSPIRVSEATCARCHASEVINERYGLPKDRVATYESSYHGLAVKGGSKIAANCTSCHGVHDIFAISDPRSRINIQNLEKTCGTCHPGATREFASIRIHVFRSPVEEKAVSIIRQIYIWLIILVIGSMLIHNAIIFLYHVYQKYRKHKAEPNLQRLSRSMVVQHILLTVSFITLVITGFALKFPDAFWARWLTALGFVEELRSLIHRIAGSTLLATAIWHLFFLFFTQRGRVEFRYLIPNLQDVRDAIQNIKYHLGLAKEKPQFHWYGYTEKLEYWALIWGTAIMGITGLVLWFPETASRLFGPWVFPVAETIHYLEAWLATLAVLVWHLFFVIYHPQEYPMSLTWLTGRITRRECKERHPRWYQEMMRPGNEELKRLYEAEGLHPEHMAEEESEAMR